MNSKQLGVEQLELQQASLAKLCLDTATLSFIRVDANGHILYANPHACKDYGYSLEEFVSISLCDIDPAIPANTSNLSLPTQVQEFRRKYCRKFLTHISQRKIPGKEPGWGSRRHTESSRITAGALGCIVNEAAVRVFKSFFP
jgi:PAS domain-containing protein